VTTVKIAGVARQGKPHGTWFRANSWGNRLEKAPKALEAIIVALPETAGSALYGMVDVLSATGTLWRQLVGEDPGTALIHPRIVSLSREPFRCGNAIPVTPDLGIEDVSKADILILPELWLAPSDDMRERYAPPLSRRVHSLFRLFRLGAVGGHRPPQGP